MLKSDLKQIGSVVWEIPQSFRPDMRVPARVFASPRMLDQLFTDRSLEQLVNITTLPGIQKWALVMPDVHEGYGFPIGGVAATAWPDGVISPGGIGYDINCGVRLLKSQLTRAELGKTSSTLVAALYNNIPSGVGRGGKLKLSHKQLDEVLKEGAIWVIKQGYGLSEDAVYTESGGVLSEADPSTVSPRAKNRGIDQLGTMGAGNHFVEVDQVDKIFDPVAAKTFALFLNQIVVLIHCGSRGLGHQVATDYIRLMLRLLPQFGISLPDRELAGAPLASAVGTDYLRAMSAAANFAWANRQVITNEVRQTWREVLGEAGGNLSMLYDVAHNIAKIETHEITANPTKLIVHRKGATRAFGPKSVDIPAAYQTVGQPVIIPGSMGTASYVLAAADEALEQSFGSCCHGAGRKMSRHSAARQVIGQQLQNQLARDGIAVQSGSWRGLAEEAPLAYKDIHDVVAVVATAGIAHPVASLKPIIVIKG